MRLNFYFIVFFSTLLMGSSFPVGGLLVASGALPFSLVAQRFLIASLVGLLVVYFLACSSKESMKLPNLGAAFVVGIFQTSGVMASVFWGLQYAPPPLIAAILFSNVLLVAAAEVMMGGRSLTTTLALSLLLGAVGLAFATGAVAFLTEAPVRGAFYGELAALGGAGRRRFTSGRGNEVLELLVRLRDHAKTSTDSIVCFFRLTLLLMLL